VQTLEKEAVEESIYKAIRTVKPSLATLPMSPATRIDSLGLESIERIMVVFEIEEAYSVSIVDQQLDTFRTVGEARDIVLKLSGATSAQ
jgi:acyl carrier protein